MDTHTYVAVESEVLYVVSTKFIHPLQLIDILLEKKNSENLLESPLNLRCGGGVVY
jgi:hypothetical protein